MSWPMVKLGDVCTINPRLPKNANPEQEVTFLAMAAVSEKGEISSQETRILHETKKGFTYFERGDVLLAKITPCFENGKATLTNNLKTQIGFGSTEFHVLRAIPELIIPEYIFYLIWNERFRVAAAKEMTGSAGQKRVSADYLKEYQFHLPPLCEQENIVETLNKGYSIQRKREQAIKLADAFLHATFLEMFSQLGDSRNRVKLGDIVALDAPMVDPRKEEYIDLIHIGPDRIEKNTGLLLPALTARDENLISKKFLFDESYVLYSKIRPYLKKCAIPDFSGLCSADMYPVKPIENKTNREFLWQLLLSDFFTKYTETLPDRANIPKLNRKELLNFEISLPPISLQEKYKTIVQKINNTKSMMRIQSSNNLLNRLTDKLFLKDQ
uniref:restriction endonuclease subunit S n=1 Tax=Citrobacter freundii TaxID=546 RepID=UPI001F4F7FA1|nr:restriction endonuclease subunit S [Citrobacter freundii]